MRYQRHRDHKDRRSTWMASFEQAVISKRPDLAGKIDWDTASFLYNSDNPAAVAAERYLANH